MGSGPRGLPGHRGPPDRFRSRVVYIDDPARCLNGAAADPLSVRAVSCPLERGRSEIRRSGAQGAFSDQMAALLIILIRTMGPAFRSRAYSRKSS
jgi:hypothetical protein